MLSAHRSLINEMETLRDNASAAYTQSAMRDSALSLKLGELLMSLERIASRLESIESQKSSAGLKDVLRQFQVSILPQRDKIAKTKTPIILESLAFSNMTVRQSRILDAHKKTFEWVYRVKELPEDDPRSRITLAEWLQSGEGIYWITGKPGMIYPRPFQPFCD